MSIFLADTNDKFQLITSAAATVDVVASGADLSGTTVTPFKQLTAITTAATTDVVAVPGASTVRTLITLFIRNKDASVTTDVTFQYLDNATAYQIHKVTLAPGEMLQYIDKLGWFHVKPTSKLFKNLRVAGSDYVNATTSFTDITGLSTAVESGKHYCFEAHLYHINDATTTGSQFGVNGPSMTTVRIANIEVVTPSATAAALSAGTATALDTAASVDTTGAVSVRLAILSGYFNPSAAGTFVIRGKSEVAVAAGLTVKVGSWLQIWEADN